jgi:RHS repeat-associated protein
MPILPTGTAKCDQSVVRDMYVLHDANFNVTALVDTDGDVVERYVYDPYGAATVYDVDWTAPQSSGYDWKYLHQGGRYEEATGLYHFRRRESSATLGRWLQVDLLRFNAGDINLYRAYRNTPIIAVDPTGEVAWIPFVVIGVVASAVWLGTPGGAQAPAGNNEFKRPPVFDPPGALVGAGIGLGAAATAFGGQWLIGAGARYCYNNFWRVGPPTGAGSEAVRQHLEQTTPAPETGPPPGFVEVAPGVWEGWIEVEVPPGLIEPPPVGPVLPPGRPLPVWIRPPLVPPPNVDPWLPPPNLPPGWRPDLPN